jgi:hypothetical protein
MSATIKVSLHCDAYDNVTCEPCEATAEGELDLRRLASDAELISEVDPPDGWRITYCPDPSGPGEHRVFCPKHRDRR